MLLQYRLHLKFRIHPLRYFEVSLQESDDNSTFTDVAQAGIVDGTIAAGGIFLKLDGTAGGDPDIDLYSATEATGVEDSPISDLTETLIINAGDAAVGTRVSGGTIAGTLATAAQGNITSLGTLTTLTVDNIIINGTNIGHTSDTDSIAIASDGVVTFSQAPVFPDGSIAVADLDIDGATDIGAAIVDADLFIVDNGAGGTNRKVTASALKTYTSGASASKGFATAMAIAL